MIYIVIIIYLVICSLTYDFIKSNKGKKVNFFIILIVLILLAGLRYRVGGDTLRYIDMYEYIPTIKNFSFNDTIFGKFQPLWTLLSSLTKSISPNFIVLQIILALIVNTTMLFFFKNNTKYYFTAILLYFLYFYGNLNFEILRESLAISMFLISIKYYKQSKWILYYICVIIAFFFHYSAIILFFLPLIKKINLRLYYLLLIFIVGASLNTLFMKNLSVFTGFGGFSESVLGYEDYNYTLFGLMSLLILYVLIPWGIRKINVSLGVKQEIYPLLSTYLFLGAMTSLFYIFSRFLNYMTPVLIIFIAESTHAIFINNLLKRIRGLIITILLLIITTSYTFKYFTSISDIVPNARWWCVWYPYYSVLDPQEDQTREIFIKYQFQQ